MSSLSGKHIPLGFVFINVLLMMTCFSCSEPDEELNILVQVEDRVLTFDEVQDIIPLDASSVDSSFLADRFIDSWIKEQVVLINAENNLPEESKNFDEAIENYRNSLLSYQYEKAIIEQKLDTLVSIEEIEEYYEENKENFLLTDFILRCRFCIIGKEIDLRNDFKSLFLSNESEDIFDLERYLVENNATYFLNDEVWLYYTELLESVPVQNYNIERFLKDNKFVEFEDGEKLYFLKILEYNLKDGVSPLSLQEESIKYIIINQRKQRLISDMKEDLYDEAARKGKIKWYTK